MKWLYNISVVSLTVMISACNSNVREGSIGSLGAQEKLLSLEDAETVEVPDQSKTIDYSRFISLFDSFSSEAMRKDGMRRMAALQLNYQNQSSIPLKSVITLFEELIRDHPLEKHDRLLYQLSREYEETGEHDAALLSLDRLVEAYPDSQYYDEAQFRRGEILFSRRNYIDAELAYRQVVGFRKYDDKSVYYEQAVYKQGWSQFKQSHYQNALDSFMHLLDLHTFEGDLVFSRMKSAERDFVDDTLRAINLCFSYQAGPLSATDYFSQKQKSIYEYQVFLSLATFYLEKKHYADAVKTYRLFVTENEMHPESPGFLLAVIGIYDEGGFPDLLLEAKKDYVQRYPVKSPVWGLYGLESLETEYNALKKNLQELASYYHGRAQKQNSSPDYRESQRWYRTWLDSFPEDKAAPRMNFLFAENMNENKQYEAAVLQYERTAYDYKAHARSAESGYAALLMYAEHEKKLQGYQQIQWHSRSIESAIRFASTFTEHPQASAVQAQVVENLYNLGEYEKAHQIALQASRSINQRDLLVTVWTVLGHIDFEWQAYVDAEASYTKALSYMSEQDANREAMLKKKAVAVYKQGEISRNKGDLDSAVKHFSRVKQVSSEVGLVASAEYDAAAALIGLRKWAQASSVLLSFRRENPGHELQPDVTRKLAFVYLESGEVEKASEEYEKVSYLPAKPELQVEAHWQAAELAEQAARTDRALDLYKAFVKRFATKVERSIEARQRLIELYERKDNIKNAQYWRVQLIQAHDKVSASATERSRYLAAKASFALAEPIFDAYRKVKLSVPLKKSLKLKKARMDKALNAYGRSASYKVPEVLTAATFRIAEIYQDLGLAIFQSERPKKLNEEELEQYDVLLEEQAYPFEEKAIEFHEINIARLGEGLDNVWIWKSLEHLKELLPVRYNKSERSADLVKEIF